MKRVHKENDASLLIFNDWFDRIKCLGFLLEEIMFLLRIEGFGRKKVSLALISLR